MKQLGGHAIYIGPDEVQIGKRESVSDVANVLSRYVSCIMYRAFSNQTMRELAKHASVPVINGLDDLEHPCQCAADLLTDLEKKRKLAGLRFVYVGDGNNVCNSLLLGCAITGMNMRAATPKDHKPNADILAKAQEIAKGNFTGRLHLPATDEIGVMAGEMDRLAANMEDEIGGHIIDCNPKSLKIFGCTKAQVIKEYPERYSPEYQPDGTLSKDVAEEKMMLALQGFPQFFEWRHRRYDGVHFDAEVSLNRVELSGKTFLQPIVRDITKRKMADEELKGERLKFQTLLEQAPFGMLLIDGNGDYTYMNPRFRELFGYTLSDAPDGRTWFRKAYPDPAYRKTVIASWKEEIRKKSRTKKMPRAFTVRSKDGNDKVFARHRSRQSLCGHCRERLGLCRQARRHRVEVVVTGNSDDSPLPDRGALIWRWPENEDENAPVPVVTGLKGVGKELYVALNGKPHNGVAVLPLDAQQRDAPKPTSFDPRRDRVPGIARSASTGASGQLIEVDLLGGFNYVIGG